MVANTHLPLSVLVRRVLLVALTCLLVATAMMLSASGASARTRLCPEANAPMANVTHNGLEHAGACQVSHVRVARRRAVLLPDRKI